MPQSFAELLLRVRADGSLLPQRAPGGWLDDQDEAWRICAEHIRRRQADGDTIVGRKIGFTNRTIWPRYGVHGPISAPVWASTLRRLPAPEATIVLAEQSPRWVQPRLEPEIVLTLSRAPRSADLAEIADCVAEVSHGVEIVHTHYVDWKFSASEAIADFSLHAALLLPPGRAFNADDPQQLAALTLDLQRDGVTIDSGSGAYVLGSPLHALAHLVEHLAAHPELPPLQAGEVITTGTLTDAYALQPGQTWATRLQGTDLAGMRLQVR